MIAVLPSTDCLEKSQVEAAESYSAKSASTVSVVAEPSEAGSASDADTVLFAMNGPRHWPGELAS